MPKTLTISEVEGILRTGGFDQLLGTIEDEQVEFKVEPYQLNADLGRMELAKDVSALANRRGGVIVIGVRTERNPTIQAEEAADIRAFRQALIDLDQYRNVLKDWVIPPIRGLTVDWFRDVADADRGLAAIFVPPEAVSERPYVVTKALGEAGRVLGSYLGYFERILATAPPTSVAELRNLLKDGMRFSELVSRLQNIEEMVAELGRPGQTAGAALADQVVAQRVSESRTALGLNGQPTFSLSAWPRDRVEFASLFRSRTADVVRLLENPPKRRAGGFDLSTRRASEIVGGELRRCMIPEIKLLELWKDGLLVFITNGGGRYLCWGMESTAQTGLRINSLALIETSYLFALLVFKLYPLSNPAAGTVSLQLELRDMSDQGVPCKLQPMELNRGWLPDMYDWREPPAAEKTVRVPVDLTTLSPEETTLRLVAQVYTWFGFEEDDVPYADRTNGPPKIDTGSFPN
jgi:hypothetical protein